ESDNCKVSADTQSAEKLVKSGEACNADQPRTASHPTFAVPQFSFVEGRTVGSKREVCGMTGSIRIRSGKFLGVERVGLWVRKSAGFQASATHAPQRQLCSA